MRFICMMIRFSLPSTIKKEHRPSPLEKRQKLHLREMVRIWIALLHQEKPEHVCVLVFLFVSTMEGARTGRRRAAPQAISPVGCCLARGFQSSGMSTVGDGRFTFVCRSFSISAAEATAASGRNRELRLGPRPAGCEACPRAETDAGSRNPGSALLFTQIPISFF